MEAYERRELDRARLKARRGSGQRDSGNERLVNRSGRERLLTMEKTRREEEKKGRSRKRGALRENCRRGDSTRPGNDYDQAGASAVSQEPDGAWLGVDPGEWLVQGSRSSRVGDSGPRVSTGTAGELVSRDTAQPPPRSC